MLESCIQVKNLGIELLKYSSTLFKVVNMPGVGGNKRPKAAAVKQASIEGTSAFLESLPDKPKEDLSLREAIDQMRDSVRSALNKGYTYQELAAMLTEKGIKISAFTLKNYVPSGRRRSSKEQGTEKTTTRRPRKAKEEAPEAVVDALDNEPDVELTPAKSESNGAAPKAEEEKAPSTRGTRGQGASAAKAKTASESTVKQTPGRRTRSSATKAKEAKPAATKGRKKS